MHRCLFGLANGVLHTEIINSYTKNLTKKRLGSSHKVVFFISKWYDK